MMVEKQQDSCCSSCSSDETNAATEQAVPSTPPKEAAEEQDSCCSSQCGPCDDSGPSQCSRSSGEQTSDAPSLSQGRQFRVNGMCCAEEVSMLKAQVGPLVGGADHLGFDLINSRMVLMEGATSVSDAAIIEAVGKTGLGASLWEAKSAAKEQEKQFARLKYFTIGSGLFWLSGLLFHLFETGSGGLLTLFSGHEGSPMPALEMGLYLVAVILGARYVAPKALYAIRRLAPDMNLLMTVAVIGAIIIGEYFEAATVAFLFALSLTLEAWSVGRARNAISSLLSLAPQQALKLFDDGHEEFVAASDMQVGDRFILRGGDRIALDGIIRSGQSAIDQAPITGESIPVSKEEGDEVYAGTINGDGSLVVEATKAAHDTVLSRIITMVQDAHSKRADVEQWVEKFARIYTPLVMLLALLVFMLPPLLMGGLWQDWFYNALVLLVIACPCALVISTPVAIVASLAAAARHGVLVKGGGFIELPSRLDALALDKTGTLTMGEPEVKALYPAKGHNPAHLLSLAAGLEARSSHPLARAILARAEEEQLSLPNADNAAIIPGRGVSGVISGTSYWLGSPRFAKEQMELSQAQDAELASIEQKGQTAILVGDEHQIIGIIALADAIRSDAKATIAALHKAGVGTIAMLTGDNEATANAVAREVGIDKVYANLLPEQKVDVIEDLMGNHTIVAMVGDGVNDAPAMARASFGIAMGAAGSDAAIETADMALMSDDIAKLPWLIGHSRNSLAIIKQNIAFALVVKAVFVILTMIGLASMWGAIVADVGTSLLVVSNALRLLRG